MKHRNHQKHLTIHKKIKEIRDGKWEELWKYYLYEYDIEKTHIEPPTEKSITQFHFP